MSIVRLDRFFADLHIGSRKQIREYIRSGRVKVNGSCVTRNDLHIDTDKDRIYFDDIHMPYISDRYYMLNKPAGAVSATRDGLSPTVLDIMSDVDTSGLFPVGRLDKDTEGLLIISDDGGLAHFLLSPKRAVEKKYEVHLKSPLDAFAVKILEEGADIGDDTPALPAKVEISGNDKNGNQVLYLSIVEGRFHEVKRMISAVGSEVCFLKRVSFGSLTLDEDLPAGAYRRLSYMEVEALKKDAGLM